MNVVEPKGAGSAEFRALKLCGTCSEQGGIMGCMSRLRRLVLCDRFFFVTCQVHRLRGKLTEAEFGCLARVLRERRGVHRFLVTAWAFFARSLARHNLSAIAADHFQGDGIGQGQRHAAH